MEWLPIDQLCAPLSRGEGYYTGSHLRSTESISTDVEDTVDGQALEFASELEAHQNVNLVRKDFVSKLKALFS